MSNFEINLSKFNEEMIGNRFKDFDDSNNLLDFNYILTNIDNKKKSKHNFKIKFLKLAISSFIIIFALILMFIPKKQSLTLDEINKIYTYNAKKLLAQDYIIDDEIMDYLDEYKVLSAKQIFILDNQNEKLDKYEKDNKVETIICDVIYNGEGEKILIFIGEEILTCRLASNQTNTYNLNESFGYRNPNVQDYITINDDHVIVNNNLKQDIITNETKKLEDNYIVTRDNNVIFEVYNQNGFRNIKINKDTIIKDSTNNILDIIDIANGKEIKVIGYELKDYIVATEIILKDNIQTKTFHSIIDIIYKPINTIKIINKVNGNEYYEIENSTIIYDKNNMVISLDELNIGSLVSIEYYQDKKIKSIKVLDGEYEKIEEEFIIEIIETEGNRKYYNNGIEIILDNINILNDKGITEDIISLENGSMISFKGILFNNKYYANSVIKKSLQYETISGTIKFIYGDYRIELNNYDKIISFDRLFEIKDQDNNDIRLIELKKNDNLEIEGYFHGQYFYAIKVKYTKYVYVEPTYYPISGEVILQEINDEYLLTSHYKLFYDANIDKEESILVDSTHIGRKIFITGYFSDGVFYVESAHLRFDISYGKSTDDILLINDEYIRLKNLDKYLYFKEETICYDKEGNIIDYQDILANSNVTINYEIIDNVYYIIDINVLIPYLMSNKTYVETCLFDKLENSTISLLKYLDNELSYNKFNLSSETKIVDIENQPLTKYDLWHGDIVEVDYTILEYRDQTIMRMNQIKKIANSNIEYKIESLDCYFVRKAFDTLYVHKDQQILINLKNGIEVYDEHQQKSILNCYGSINLLEGDHIKLEWKVYETGKELYKITFLDRESGVKENKIYTGTIKKVNNLTLVFDDFKIKTIGGYFNIKNELITNVNVGDLVEIHYEEYKEYGETVIKYQKLVKLGGTFKVELYTGDKLYQTEIVTAYSPYTLPVFESDFSAKFNGWNYLGVLYTDSIDAYKDMKVYLNTDCIFTFEYGDEITITGMQDNNITDVKLPNTILNKPVTKIGDYAFRNNKNILSFDSCDVKKLTIGRNAFSGCKNLVTINLQETDFTCNQYAFSECTSLVNFISHYKIKGQTYSLFKGSTSIKEVAFDESVTEINAYCFENCVSLEKVTFLGKVTKIGEKAFYNCEKLTDIDLSNVEIISSKAFYNNIFIEKINLPSIKKIADYAFGNCKSLKEIVIGNTLESLGSRTLYNCINIETITTPFIGTSIVYLYHIGVFFGGEEMENAHRCVINDNEVYDRTFIFYVPMSLKTVNITKVSAENMYKFTFEGCKYISSINYIE